MGILSYTNEHTEYLSSKDERLGAFISEKGYVERAVFDDVFAGLCYNIVNQQISMKACEALWVKLTALLGEVTPYSCTDAARLRACGLSQSKADCITECARRFISAEITADGLERMSDAEVIKALTSVKGIGRWTAEMTLIFCLRRMDVLSLSDFGIRKGLSLLHGVDMKDVKAMEKYRLLYSPYGTVASVYLWEAARELSDNKEK